MSKIIEQDLPKELLQNEIRVTKEATDYEIKLENGDIVDINFMNGARNTPEANDGVTHEDLLYIILDRIIAFEDKTKSGENVDLIRTLITALMLCHSRTLKRHHEGILGSKVDYDEN